MKGKRWDGIKDISKLFETKKSTIRIRHIKRLKTKEKMKAFWEKTIRIRQP